MKRKKAVQVSAAEEKAAAEFLKRIPDGNGHKNGFTQLEVNGKTYDLIYDFDSLIQAEEQTGIELLVGVDWRRIKAARLRAMLYACMLKTKPDVTLAEIGKLITHKNVPRIEVALVDCWVNAGQEAATETPA